MAIIKDYNNIECLGQYEDIKVYIKKAVNRFVDGIEDIVVTKICFKDLENNNIYEYNEYNSYICKLNDTNNNFFNLIDIIEDLSLYVSKCNIEKYFKDITITNILKNNYKGLLALKTFKMEYYKEIDNSIKREKAEKYKKDIELIENDIIKTIDEIKTTSKESIKINKPSKYNNFCYELFTKNTYKKFDTLSLYYDVTGLEEYKNMLSFFKDYLYYINIDFDPKEFLKFD